MDPERLDQLQNPDPAVRREAIIALGRSKDLAALPELAKVYKNDPVPELRELARQAGRYIQQENRPAPEPPSPPVSSRNQHPTTPAQRRSPRRPPRRRDREADVRRGQSHYRAARLQAGEQARGVKRLALHADQGWRTAGLHDAGEPGARRAATRGDPRCSIRASAGGLAWQSRRSAGATLAAEDASRPILAGLALFRDCAGAGDLVDHRPAIDGLSPLRLAADARQAACPAGTTIPVRAIRHDPE